MCGGTGSRRVGRPGDTGLSPRVRGNLLLIASNGRCHGSIPACAGEPTTSYRLKSSARVYPRVCGGTPVAQMSREAYEGLSPRVRGNQKIALRSAGLTGSIPACAGEPFSGSCHPKSERVYPRVCGGTLTPGTRTLPSLGLSPRVRGNLVGGGVWLWILGLSPRVRGNHRPQSASVARWGSIPACAGEPSSE